MQIRDFFVQMKATDGRGEVLIYDAIGEPSLLEPNRITAKAIREKLDGLGEIDGIDVRINSIGGSFFHAVAIYNALIEHPAEVTVYVDGLAASAASLIAMAGDERFIAEAGQLMIHNPIGVAIGEANDLRAAAGMLDKVRDSAINLYSARTGNTPAKIGEWMDDETWMTGDEAVEKGFADSVVPNKTASRTPVTNQGLQLVAMFAGDVSQYESILLRTQKNCGPGGCPCNRKETATMSQSNTEKYRKEYAEKKHVHAQLGISVDDYVEQRLIEDGEKPDPVETLQTSQQRQTGKSEFAGLPGLVDPNDDFWTED